MFAVRIADTPAAAIRGPCSRPPPRSSVAGRCSRAVKDHGPGEKPRVIPQGARSPCRSDERRGRYFELLCQPLNQRFGGLFHLCQRDVRMAKKRELHGEADSIGTSAPPRHKVLVSARKGEAPRGAAA